MKKLCSIFTCFSILLLFLCAPSSAAASTEQSDPSVSFSVNEYDAIVSNSNSIGVFSVPSTAESLAMEELSYRNTLSDRELQEYYGYSEQEISILRSYDGGPLKDNPQLRGIFGTVHGEIDKEAASKTSLTVSYTWYWEGEPLVMGFSETIAVRWQGAITSSGGGYLKFNEAGSSATVNYYWPDGREHSTIHPEFQNISPYEHTYIVFETSVEAPRAFARDGEIIIKVDLPDGLDGYIAEGAFLFNYGHGELRFDAGVSFPPSFSISFEPFKEQMWYGGATLSSSGKLTRFTPTVT